MQDALQATLRRLLGGCALALAVAAAPALAAPTPPAGAARESAPEAEPPLRRTNAPENGHVSVTIDRAKIIRLPERTSTVIVGNPAIADVTTQRNGVLVLTGKSYGATNLIALDSAGNLLAESSVSVQAPTETVVTVQRGLERESYSCTPNCQPSLLLGDSPKYFTDVGSQAGARNDMATKK